MVVKYIPQKITLRFSFWYQHYLEAPNFLLEDGLQTCYFYICILNYNWISQQKAILAKVAAFVTMLPSMWNSVGASTQLSITTYLSHCLAMICPFACWTFDNDDVVEPNADQYDVFIFYSDHQKSFVEEELVEELESPSDKTIKPKRYKLRIKKKIGNKD